MMMLIERGLDGKGCGLTVKLRMAIDADER